MLKLYHLEWGEETDEEVFEIAGLAVDENFRQYGNLVMLALFCLAYRYSILNGIWSWGLYKPTFQDFQ